MKLNLLAKIKDLRSSFGKTAVVLETDYPASEIESFMGKDLDISIKQHKDSRSNEANRKLWACLRELADAVGTDNWTMYLTELRRYGVFENIRISPEAYEDFKKRWRETQVVGNEFVTVSEKNPVTGYTEEVEKEYLVVNCYFGSHTYDTKEFSRLLQGVIDDMESAGLPSYEMKQLLKQMENEDAK